MLRVRPFSPDSFVDVFSSSFSMARSCHTFGSTGSSCCPAGKKPKPKPVGGDLHALVHLALVQPVGVSLLNQGATLTAVKGACHAVVSAGDGDLQSSVHAWPTQESSRTNSQKQVPQVGLVQASFPNVHSNPLVRSTVSYETTCTNLDPVYPTVIAAITTVVGQRPLSSKVGALSASNLGSS